MTPAVTRRAHLIVFPGKSCFLWYAIARLAQLKEVFLYLIGTTIYIFYKGKVYQRKDIHSVFSFLQRFKRDMDGMREKPVFCLLDLDADLPGEIVASFVHLYVSKVVFTVLVTSPKIAEKEGKWNRRANYGIATLYMPLWESYELKKA